MTTAKSTRKSSKPPVSMLVETKGQQIWTTSLIVAEGCGLEHASVIKTIRKHQTHFEQFGFLGFEIQEKRGTQGAQTEYAILNEDQATFAITLFRNNERVIDFKVALVKAFRAAINELHRIQRQQFRLDWQQARQEARVEFRLMNETLKAVRGEQGKETKAHHYTNEARLINGVLNGCFKGMDRASLTTDELVALVKLEFKNTVMIGRGIAYAERKTALLQYAATFGSVPAVPVVPAAVHRLPAAVHPYSLTLV